jgi:hypothetical protein
MTGWLLHIRVAIDTRQQLERGSRQGSAVVLWCCGAVVLWFIAVEKHLQ